MVKIKKVITVLAVAAITLSGACATPNSKIAFNNTSVLSVSAINYDATLSYENQYGKWTFYVDKGTTKSNFTDATLCVRGFTPKNSTFCSYASIPSTASGTITQYGKNYSVKNLKVTAINCNAFHNSIIESVYIPGSVEVIQASAFDGCKNLTTVSIGNNSKLRLLNSDCFKGCTSLKYITLPNTLTDIMGGVFNGCSSLKNINIPSSVKEIYPSTFGKCTSLQNINCSLTDTTFCGEALKGCDNLKTINCENIIVNNDINPKIAPIFARSNYGDYKFIDDVMDRKITQIVNEQTKDCKNDYQKAKALHDWICKKVYYDEEDVWADENHCDYSVFLHEKTVCEGYARAYAILMQKAGIEAYNVTGETIYDQTQKRWIGHAWNIVKLNGMYYHVDCCWDDEVSDRTGTHFGYDNFLKLDSVMSAKDYHKKTIIEYPSAIYQRYNNPKTIECKYLLGDGNLDGGASQYDCDLLKDYVMGHEYNPKIKNVNAFDLNGDGNIDLTDLSIFGFYMDDPDCRTMEDYLLTHNH